MSGWATERSTSLPLRMMALYCPRASTGWERDGGRVDTATGEKNSGEGSREAPALPRWGPSSGRPCGQGGVGGRVGSLGTRALGMILGRLHPHPSAASPSVRGAAMTLKGCRAELVICASKAPEATWRGTYTWCTSVLHCVCTDRQVGSGTRVGRDPHETWEVASAVAAKPLPPLSPLPL